MTPLDFLCLLLLGALFYFAVKHVTPKPESLEEKERRLYDETEIAIAAERRRRR